MADGGGHDWNPANSAKEQRDYLKDWFNHAGAVPWQDGKVWLVSEEQEQIISTFQGHPIIPETFLSAVLKKKWKNMKKITTLIQ